jgi:sulfur-oxidizing protein SoxB
VAHNVTELNWAERPFRPYTIREVGGSRVGVIGQAFPYTPVSHPRRFVPDLTFGIREDGIQALVNELRDVKKVDLVVLLSHNGVAVDLKLAGRVHGLDVVFGGHTVDAPPQPIRGPHARRNPARTASSLSRLDMDVQRGRVGSYRYRLIPVLAQDVPADP